MKGGRDPVTRVPVTRIKEWCPDCGEFLAVQVGIPAGEGMIRWGGVELAPWLMPVPHEPRHYRPNAQRQSRGGQMLVVHGPDPVTIECRCRASTTLKLLAGTTPRP